MNKKNAISKINKWLLGSYIDKVTYYVTGWELSFVNNGYQISSIFSDIKTLKPNNWTKLKENSPIDLENTNEPKDTINSIVLFTVLNKHSVIGVEIDEENKLSIEFENETRIQIPSIDKMIDCTWVLNEIKGERIKCEWGKIITD